MFVFTENFKKGDYIINHSSGDIAIYSKTDNRGYMHFSKYYTGMSKYLKSDNELKNYTMQINYQKFFELCNEEEKGFMDEMIKKEKG